MSKRINFTMTRNDASVLFAVLGQAIDESDGTNAGMVIEPHYSIVIRLNDRLWGLLQKPRKQSILGSFLTGEPHPLAVTR